MDNPAITDDQRADLLSRIRSGYDLEAAAVDVGIDAVAAMHDPDLAHEVAAAYAIGTSRLRARALEFSLSSGDVSALLRFIDKREQATQAALKQVHEPAISLGVQLANFGLAPPPGKSATVWFVDLLQRARKLLQEEAEPVPGRKPGAIAVHRAKSVLAAAGISVAYIERVDRSHDALTDQSPTVIDPDAQAIERAIAASEGAHIRPQHQPHIDDDNHSLAAAVRAGRIINVSPRRS